MNSIKSDFQDLIKFLVIYHSRKTKLLATNFELFKDKTVILLMHRRGKFQTHVWHTSMIGLASVGILTSGVFGGNSLVASTFPGMVDQDPRLIQTFDPNAAGISLNNLIDMKTLISSKPRSEVIEYEVKPGETLSQIASKFGVSNDTVKWANDITDINSVKPGQKIKILPVSGVSHKVSSGDTLESVAKKYSADSQAILDFPFNDIPDDFKLKVGQVLIVPDGQPPEIKFPVIRRIQPQYLAQGPSSPTFSAPGGGNFIWPTVTSGLSQYFAWYHPGIDLPNRNAPAVVASDGGVVTVAGWPDNFGYGNRVMIDHGNGYISLYAHLSNIYVSSGQTVSRGQTIGQMGSTGRSTGTHLHFEIRFKGIAINPLSILH
ncbi:M23 family metallopeptidase [Candidatus Daviesbacteria bacterium]|nr:M23 family metallopeptidase [Candidatus Daviesbacteria bacterium]